MSGEWVWDAVIVGGGPAGSACAIHLARAGASVLLLDRDRFPRPKPCGECLSPGAVRELDALGVLPQVLHLPHTVLNGWTIRSPHGASFDGSFAMAERGLAVQRRLLDALLLAEAARAGAEVRGGVRVAEPLMEGAAVVGVRLTRAHGEEAIRARLVIGADGLRSVIARRLQLVRRPPRLRKLALTAHVKIGDEDEPRGELQVLPNGCMGIAAVGDGLANVTVVVADSRSAGVAGGRESHFDATLAGHPRARSWTRVDEVLATGPFDVPVRGAVMDGALLVGDAAGYFDPFTGQGMYRALKGAALASEVAAAALAKGDVTASAMRPYERARRTAFAPTQRLQRVIEAVISRPHLFQVAARGLRAAPRLSNALVRVTGDIAPVYSLLRPTLFVPQVTR